jgi:hypothetical protein
VVVDMFEETVHARGRLKAGVAGQGRAL